MTLSTEIAAARPEEQREVLERLWECIHGKAPKWHEWYGDARISHDARYFRRMLDCGAFLSAAEMLVPGDRKTFGSGHSWNQRRQREMGWAFVQIGALPVFEAIAATPALALAAAIAKSFEDNA